MKVLFCPLLVSGLAVLFCHAGDGGYQGQPGETVEQTGTRPHVDAAEHAAGATRSVDLGGGVTMEMVWVPAGTFMMGSTLGPDDVASIYGGEPEHFTDEHPRDEVTISTGFWMGKYEVTNAQYRRFKADHFSREYRGNRLDGDRLPAVYVSWRESQAFCDWLSEQTGDLFALPTEAQWEYACRAGTDTVRYWGNDNEGLGRHANVADRTAESVWRNWATIDETTDGHTITAPVGSFRPNAFGLFDMIGNVHEWCRDYYDAAYYARRPAVDPCNTVATTSRVNRGGGWESTAEACRAANRSGDDPDDHYGSVGFRVTAP